MPLKQDYNDRHRPGGQPAPRWCHPQGHSGAGPAHGLHLLPLPSPSLQVACRPSPTGMNGCSSPETGQVVSFLLPFWVPRHPLKCLGFSENLKEPFPPHPLRLHVPDFLTRRRENLGECQGTEPPAAQMVTEQMLRTGSWRPDASIGSAGPGSDAWRWGSRMAAGKATDRGAELCPPFSLTLQNSPVSLIYISRATC